MIQMSHLIWHIIRALITRGNKYEVINHRFHYDLRKYYFSARTVNIWNSLPNHVVDVNSVNVFKARLDRFWMDQDVKYDFMADLTGTGDRSVNVISDIYTVSQKNKALQYCP